MNSQSILILILNFVLAVIIASNADAALQLGRKFAPRRLPQSQRLFSIASGDSDIVPSLMTATENVFNFLSVVGKLKIEKRTGWHKYGIPHDETESIADHMYRMSMIVLSVQDDEIDKFKALKMALVHDMAEAIVGDITPDCGISQEEKMRLETEAMAEIRSLLGDNPFGQEAEELWAEYAANSTKESRFVKDVDKTELILQLGEYESKYGISFQSWVNNARPKINHPALQAIADAVLTKRSNLSESK
jgi:putative hydrolase of HD superfamily